MHVYGNTRHNDVLSSRTPISASFCNAVYLSHDFWRVTEVLLSPWVDRGLPCRLGREKKKEENIRGTAMFHPVAYAAGQEMHLGRLDAYC